MKNHLLAKLVLLISLLLLAACNSNAESEEIYPAKEITMISPYGAGGGSDLVTRVIAKHLEKQLDQAVVVQNVTGQSGVLGGKKVVDAKPDGYTLLIQHSGVLALYHSGAADYTYSDFEPVALMVSGAEAIAVNANSPYDSIDDLIEDAKKRPGKLKYGASLGGTSQYLAESIMDRAGIEFQLVPYDGESERGTALAGGHVDIISGSFPSLAGYVEAGNVKILAVVDNERNSVYPDIPTLAEEGLDVTDSYVARGLFAPKGVSEETMKILIDALEKISVDPAFAEDLAKLSYDPRFIPGEEYIRYLEEQDKKIEALTN